MQAGRLQPRQGLLCLLAAGLRFFRQGLAGRTSNACLRPGQPAGQVFKTERGSIMRENLKSARKAKNMTQQAMADKLGLTLNHYQKIEYGKLNGSFEVWDALEDLLGVHQRILREIPSKHPSQVKNPQEH